MRIKEYLEKMVIYSNEWNSGKCIISQNHYKQYESYCLECEEHLCEKCLQSRNHLFHRKVNLKEILLTQNELKDLDKALKYIRDKKEYKKLKELIEIIYDTYKKYNNNYYYFMNIQFILDYLFDNYETSQYNLSKEEYQHSVEIKNEKEQELEKMKSDHEIEISNLKKVINDYEVKLSSSEVVNEKLSKEINKLKNKINEIN